MTTTTDRRSTLVRPCSPVIVTLLVAASALLALPRANASKDNEKWETKLTLNCPTDGAVAYIDGELWGALPKTSVQPKKSGSVKVVVLCEDYAVLRRRVALRGSSDTVVTLPALKPASWPTLESGDGFSVAWESKDLGWFDGGTAPPGAGRLALGRRGRVTQFGSARKLDPGEVVRGEPSDWEPRPAMLDLWDAAHGTTVRLDGEDVKDGAPVALGSHALRVFANRKRQDVTIEVLPGQRVVRVPPLFSDPDPIAAAHTWLATHQAPDGRWSSSRMKCSCAPRCEPGAAGLDVGVTGLALLALLDGGNTPTAGPHADAVAKGLGFLMKAQSEDGFFQPAGARGATFAQPIAELAVLEAWGATGDEKFAAAAERGLAAIYKCQNPYLAWRYGVRDGDNDTAVTVWMTLAISTAARMDLGLAPFSDVRPDSRTAVLSLRGAHHWFAKMTDPSTGNIGYQRRGGGRAYRPKESGRSSDMRNLRSGDWSLTAMAMLAKRRIARVNGEDPDTPDTEYASDLSLAGIAENAPFADPDPQVYFDVHAAWFGARVLRSARSAWPRRWKDGMQRLAGLQRSNGSFEPDRAFSATGGSVFTTSMAALALQQWLRQ